MIHEYELDCPYCGNFNNIETFKNNLEIYSLLDSSYDLDTSIQITCEACKKDFFVDLSIELEPKLIIKKTHK